MRESRALCSPIRFVGLKLDQTIPNKRAKAVRDCGDLYRDFRHEVLQHGRPSPWPVVSRSSPANSPACAASGPTAVNAPSSRLPRRRAARVARVVCRQYFTAMSFLTERWLSTALLTRDSDIVLYLSPQLND